MGSLSKNCFSEETKSNLSYVTILLKISNCDSIKWKLGILLFKKTKKLDIGLIVMSAGFGNYGEFISNDISENSKMIDLHCKHRVEMSHYYGNIFKSKN